jgi:Flp pilus assembly protein TadD
MVQVRPSHFTFAKYQLVLICLAMLCGATIHAQSATLILNIRDPRGVPVDGTIVTLTASVGSYNQTLSTSNAASVTFEGLTQGEYDAEARCAGYQSTTEHISVTAAGSAIQLYIYLLPESDQKSQGPSPQGIVMSPKLQAEIGKGLEAMRRRQFEVARTHFSKGLSLAPGNPDLSYLLGSAELGLNHVELARQNFEHALTIDATHERSLLALGELQLRNGETAAAVATLEKAFLKNGAGWRTHLLLATAYAKAGRLPDAETHARRAGELGREKGAGARLLLGEIQRAEGKLPEAKLTWQEIVTRFPGDPSAAEAKKRIASLSAPQAVVAVSSEAAALANLPVPATPAIELLPAKERPWAPPDVDSREYPLAKDASCSSEEILPQAENRMKAQLKNFEKFTATEHIEHQEIDRLGRPGPVKSRDFSYIVFVNHFAGDSFFLDEDRHSNRSDSSFPTSLATTGLNNLGVSILQPAIRGEFSYQCEGLASIRGKATWQIRFQESKNSTTPVRQWQREGKIYPIAIKGRIWLSSASFDVLRIETDLLEPVEVLGLSRDHLVVDYGPVSFSASNATLWLPWDAEMHMELRGHRYHHKHYLTDYMLFGVDTNHKIGKPKNVPAPSTQAAPAGDPN